MTPDVEFLDRLIELVNDGALKRRKGRADVRDAIRGAGIEVLRKVEALFKPEEIPSEVLELPESWSDLVRWARAAGAATLVELVAHEAGASGWAGIVRRLVDLQTPRGVIDYAQHQARFVRALATGDDIPPRPNPRVPLPQLLRRLRGKGAGLVPGEKEKLLHAYRDGRSLNYREAADASGVDYNYAKSTLGPQLKRLGFLEASGRQRNRITPKGLDHLGKFEFDG